MTLHDSPTNRLEALDNALHYASAASKAIHPGGSARLAEMWSRIASTMPEPTEPAFVWSSPEAVNTEGEESFEDWSRRQIDKIAYRLTALEREWAIPPVQNDWEHATADVLEYDAMGSDGDVTALLRAFVAQHIRSRGGDAAIVVPGSLDKTTKFRIVREQFLGMKRYSIRLT